MRIDHFAIVDFTSFTELIYLVGGVDLPTPDGTQHMSGGEALTYVRERYGLPGGDFRSCLAPAGVDELVFDSFLTPKCSLPVSSW